MDEWKEGGKEEKNEWMSEVLYGKEGEKDERKEDKIWMKEGVLYTGKEGKKGKKNVEGKEWILYSNEGRWEGV